MRTPLVIILAVSLAPFLLLLSGACSGDSDPAEDAPVTLTLLHNSDGESALLPLSHAIELDGATVALPVGGIAAFQAVTGRELAQARAAGHAVLNVYAGDAYLAGATLICSRMDGQPLFDAVAQRALPYDAHIIGNHEFDSGPGFLERFIRAFPGQPFLSANLDFSAETGFGDLVDSDGLIDGAVEGGRVIGRAMIVTDQSTGARFGLVGATTPSLPILSSPGQVSVTPDLAATAAVVQGEIDRLLERGVNKIILVSHLQSIANDLDLLRRLRGVDVAVAGGGDELLQNPEVDSSVQQLPGEQAEADADYPIEATDASGRTVYVVTTAGNYKYLGRLDLRFDMNGEVSGVLSETSYPRPVVPATEAAAATGFAHAVEEDADLLDMVARPLSDCLAGFATIRVATTEVVLDLARASVRTRETNSGNLVADAFLHSYDRHAADLGLPARSGINLVIAVENGGGIRQGGGDTLPSAGVAPGEIYLLNTLDLLPFGNAITVIPGVSAQDLKAAFELSISRYPEPAGGFLHVAGIAVVYDPAREPGARVVSLTLDGGIAIVSDGAIVAGAPSVTVVTNSFLAGGGDGYEMFQGYADRLQLAVSDEQSLRGYLEHLGTVARDDRRYAPGGEGRIRFLAGTTN